MQNAISHLKMPFAVFIICAAIPAASQAQTGPTEAAADDIAAQIRQQGYACEAPVSAEREGESWILRCANASYQVQLVPDMAAQVQKIN